MSTDLIIDLDAPQDGVVPKALHNLHEEQLKEAVLLIRRLAKPAQAKRAASLAPLGAAAKATPPTRRGLLIEGERGIGKTSFLYALGEAVNDKERVPPEDSSAGQPQVHALPLLDPTLISGDRTFIAAVIANILGEVERCLGHQNSCDPRHRDQRQALDKSVKALHGGLIAEGEDTWRGLTARDSNGHQFVDHLLQMARGGIDLAPRFEDFCRAAADLLGADMLLQPLDDVDLAGPEAYTTLEAVRRYMTGPSLLPVVAGDLQQFIGVIWERRLAEEKRGLRAREGRSASARKQREADLIQVAAQHIEKLLPVQHRFPLQGRRQWVLEKAACSVGGVLVPVLGRISDGVLAKRDSCLVGLAEKVLLPSPATYVSMALLPLFPENTRKLFTVLRLLRDCLPRAQNSAEFDSLAALNSLARLGQVSEDALLSRGLRTRDLHTMATRGPLSKFAPALADSWRRISQEHKELTSEMDFGLPTDALFQVALAQWMAARPGRAVSLLGKHALYLAPWPESQPLHDLPDVLAAGRSISGHALGAAIFADSAAEVDSEDLSDGHAAGMWLPRTRPGTRISNRHFGAVMANLYETYATTSNELAPYHAMLRAGGANVNSVGGAFLRLHRALQFERPDLVCTLLLARTLLPATGDPVWMVDPCRTLEAAAQLLAVTEGRPPKDEAALVSRELRRLLRADAPAELGSDRVIKVDSGAFEVVRPPGVQFDRSVFVQKTIAWVKDVGGWSAIPDPSSVARAHKAWQLALEDVADEYSGGVPTVGGYLQRATVCLLASVIESELAALVPQTLTAELKRTWLAISQETDRSVVFAERDGLTVPVDPARDWTTAGRLHALIEFVERMTKAASSGAAKWASKKLPLSTILATCPLLVVHLSPQWKARLSAIWPVPLVAEESHTVDVYTLLCGIPMRTMQMGSEYPTVEWFDETIGKEILSPTERRVLASLSKSATSP